MRHSLILVASFFVNAVSFGQFSSADTAVIGETVRKELQDTRTPGAVIGVVLGDDLVFVEAYGSSNVETGAPMRTDMLFRLGSTTKMMTASALLALAEQGKIRLHEGIGGSVPGLHPSLGRLTPHHLLSNSSGMADVAPPFISSDDTALGLMVRHWGSEVTFAEPGKVNSYSSAGFWLTGYVVEVLTGMPYGQAMEQLFFKPVGMSRSTLYPLVALTYPMSQGHRPSGGGGTEVVRPFFNNVAMWPAGSVFSNVFDLSRFLIAILNSGTIEGRQVFPASRVRALEGKHIGIPGEPDAFYGYGTLTLVDRGVEFVMHGGFSRGYGSMIQWSPKHRVGVIVLTNSSGQTLSRSRGEILKRLVTFDDGAGPPTPAARPLSIAERTALIGTYVNGPQEWQVIARSDSLFVRYGGEETFVQATGPLTLSYGDDLSGSFNFVAGTDGTIEFLHDGLYAARKK